MRSLTKTAANRHPLERVANSELYGGSGVEADKIYVTRCGQFADPGSHRSKHMKLTSANSHQKQELSGENKRRNYSGTRCAVPIDWAAHGCFCYGLFRSDMHKTRPLQAAQENLHLEAV